ncbi:hypothetical protein ABZ532_21875 [Streptomyces sp. NPDC019396]|uniref:hypothetical protein n=1 Tax=Streptomyces sp. NPDC019396 TaxID=3154687 RepID=UPI0033F64DC3
MDDLIVFVGSSLFSHQGLYAHAGKAKLVDIRGMGVLASRVECGSNRVPGSLVTEVGTQDQRGQITGLRQRHLVILSPDADIDRHQTRHPPHRRTRIYPGCRAVATTGPDEALRPLGQPATFASALLGGQEPLGGALVDGSGVASFLR